MVYISTSNMRKGRRNSPEIKFTQPGERLKFKTLTAAFSEILALPHLMPERQAEI